MVGNIIERGIRSFAKRILLDIDREVWMKEVEAAERAGSVLTCQAIIQNTIWVGVEEEDRKTTWSYICSRPYSISDKKSWLKADQLEKSHGTRESLDSLLLQAVTYRPQAEVLWLMGAKGMWLAGDVPAARAILQEAYAAIPNSEEIWLAAFKLEFENHEPERARMLLAKARERGGTERRIGSKERKLLEEGLQLFPSFFKFWLMLGQLDDRLVEQAKESGIKHCPSCIPLWLSLARREIQKKNPEFWAVAVRAESRNGNKKESEILIAKALQEGPASGILWATSIEMVPRPQRKTKKCRCSQRCDNDPHVIVVDKARNWLNRVVMLAPDFGDFWAMYYKFELQHGIEETQRDVMKRCAISKAVENSHLPVDAILKKAVVVLGKDENAAESGKN
ncbi:hypothetical protein MKW94_011774 [Papaver nudicaule]|uniref:PRP1 splicing factor N-terminal domain-containing protein n=1 Tax=Papaver nudicaule TaxID=74823 RepID=A0AA41S9P4_PAPNU|nr:hypothetical protein [Papaver nudicaule]